MTDDPPPLDNVALQDATAGRPPGRGRVTLLTMALLIAASAMVCFLFTQVRAFLAGGNTARLEDLSAAFNHVATRVLLWTVLPSIAISAWRRAPLDHSLAQIMLACALACSFLLTALDDFFDPTSAEYWPLGCLAGAVVLPLVALQVTTPGMRPPAARAKVEASLWVVIGAAASVLVAYFGIMKDLSGHRRPSILPPPPRIFPRVSPGGNPYRAPAQPVTQSANVRNLEMSNLYFNN